MKTICYLAGGYPTMEKSLEAAELYLRGGCDAIEWCVPPKDPYADPPYIAEKLRQAREVCGDTMTHLRAIADFRRRHPEAEVILLAYQEILEELTAEYTADFCLENGIRTVLSGNLDDRTIIETLTQKGIEVAASMNYTMYPQELERVKSGNGFIYLQAMPSQEDLAAGRGPETLRKMVETLRAMGIDRPIYCGVGIRKPEDVAFIRESGGQGFFLGSSLIQYYDEPQCLIETIQAYKKAGQDPA